MSFRVLIIGAVVSTKLLPQTYLLQRYRQFRATYGFDDKELPVPKKVQQRFREVMDDLKLSEEARNKIQIFSVHDINIFHAGSTLAKSGAIIGIPPNFEYESADNLTIEHVNIQNKHIPWTEETSRKFLQSLVLSENAQKFAIAREILKVQRYDFWMKPINLILDFTLAFTFYDIIYLVLKLNKKAKYISHMFKVVVGLTGFVVWTISEELIDSNADREVAQQLAALHPKYVQGGKEFYEKLCERESVLIYFLRQSNLHLYETFWIKRTELPPSEQKQFFTLKLQEIEAA